MPDIAAELDAATAAARRVLTTTTTKTTVARNFELMTDKVAAEAAAAKAAHSPIDPKDTVLLRAATCDTLMCPAGYDHRPAPFTIPCGGEPGLLRCSMDIDKDRCCSQKVAWWTYLLALLSVFCLLSMLCSFLGGLSDWYCPRKRVTSSQRAKTDATKEADEEETLGFQPSPSVGTTIREPAPPFALPQVAGLNQQFNQQFRSSSSNLTAGGRYRSS